MPYEHIVRRENSKDVFIRPNLKSVKIRYTYSKGPAYTGYWLEPVDKPLNVIGEELKFTNQEGGRDFTYKITKGTLHFTLSYRNVKRVLKGVITRGDRKLSNT